MQSLIMNYFKKIFTRIYCCYWKKINAVLSRKNCEETFPTNSISGYEITFVKLVTCPTRNWCSKKTCECSPKSFFFSATWVQPIILPRLKINKVLPTRMSIGPEDVKRTIRSNLAFNLYHL